jgi:hypothetical protein
MIHVRIKAVTPNKAHERWDTVMPARGMPRYEFSEGQTGAIELDILVDHDEDLMARAMQICNKLAELDFVQVERPWVY